VTPPIAVSVIAYNLGNLWRRLVLPNRIGNWSLTSLQQRLVKTGGRLVKHARYYWLLLTESHLTRRLFGAMEEGSPRSTSSLIGLKASSSPACGSSPNTSRPCESFLPLAVSPER